VDLLLQKLQQFFEERALEGYLVGGSLRDLLLGEQPQDLDFAVPGDPEPVARALADELRGRFAALNLQKGVKRVILPRHPYDRLILDIAPLRGEDMIADLRLRDLTINALALPVAALSALTPLRAPSAQPPALLVDPFNGWRDLRARVARVVQPDVFQKDARRLLRIIRLSTSHRLSIDPATASLMTRDAPLLRQTAPERIRDELLQMLAPPTVGAAVRALDAYHLFPSIFPTLFASENPAAPSDTPPGSRPWPTLTSMAALLSAAQGEEAALASWEEELLAPLLRLSHRPAFKKRWKPSPVRACTRSDALLLAALLADLLPDAQLPGEPTAEQLRAMAAALKRLAIGHQPTALIIFLLQESAAPWGVEARPQTSSSGVWRGGRRYFERFGERGVDLAAFALARQMAVLQGATPDDAWQARARTLLHLIEGYVNEREALIPPVLLDGAVLITRLGLARGPLIGALLARVRSAQLDGLVRTRAEALQFIREHISTAGKEEAC
jgi:poly(A) polymerase